MSGYDEKPRLRDLLPVGFWLAMLFVVAELVVVALILPRI